jgi:hypothetical protein
VSQSLPWQNSPLFDHVIGEREQCRGHVEGERLGGSQIDDQLEAVCLLCGQIAWQAFACVPRAMLRSSHGCGLDLRQ